MSNDNQATPRRGDVSGGRDVEAALQAVADEYCLNHPANYGGCVDCSPRVEHMTEAVERIFADRLAAVDAMGERCEFLLQAQQKAVQSRAEMRVKLRSAEADAAVAQTKVERVRRALDDEIANLADDGARLSHSVVRRIEAALGGAQ